MLKIMEEQGLGEKKFFGGERIGIVDIAFGIIAHWFGVDVAKRAGQVAGQNGSFLNGSIGLWVNRVTG